MVLGVISIPFSSFENYRLFQVSRKLHINCSNLRKFVSCSKLSRSAFFQIAVNLVKSPILSPSIATKDDANEVHVSPMGNGNFWTEELKNGSLFCLPYPCFPYHASVVSFSDYLVTLRDPITPFGVYLKATINFSYILFFWDTSLQQIMFQHIRCFKWELEWLSCQNMHTKLPLHMEIEVLAQIVVRLFGANYCENRILIENLRSYP